MAGEAVAHLSYLNNAAPCQPRIARMLHTLTVARHSEFMLMDEDDGAKQHDAPSVARRLKGCSIMLKSMRSTKGRIAIASVMTAAFAAE